MLREKYAKGAERELEGAEAARAVRRRVARALAAVEARSRGARGARSSTALEDGFIPGRADQLGGRGRGFATSR